MPDAPLAPPFFYSVSLFCSRSTSFSTGGGGEGGGGGWTRIGGGSGEGGGGGGGDAEAHGVCSTPLLLATYRLLIRQ
ncbi:hypothetical protein ANTPLA_LOCUS8318 [Anthophora plagiata]